jgi:hypothetical protein
MSLGASPISAQNTLYCSILHIFTQNTSSTPLPGHFWVSSRPIPRLGEEEWARGSIQVRVGIWVHQKGLHVYPTEKLNQICRSIYGLFSINYCAPLFLKNSPGPTWFSDKPLSHKVMVTRTVELLQLVDFPFVDPDARPDDGREGGVVVGRRSAFRYPGSDIDECVPVPFIQTSDILVSIWCSAAWIVCLAENNFDLQVKDPTLTLPLLFVPLAPVKSWNTLIIYPGLFTLHLL